MPEAPRGAVAARVSAWLHRRLVEPVLALLRQGITPGKLALSLALGIGFGIFPVLGVSTVLCTAAALVLRLNLPAIQLVNYAAAPVQLLLIIPFVRVGEHLVGAAPQPLSIGAGFALMRAGVLRAVVTLADAIVHAAIGWAVIGPFLIYALYQLFRPLLEQAAARLASRSGPDGTSRSGG